MKAALDCAERLEKEYELPDRIVVMVGSEQFKTPEALFQPSLLDKEAAACVRSRASQCDPNIRSDLYSNIVLFGGTIKCPGFTGRMFKELTALAPFATKVKVVLPPVESDYAVWTGGSIVPSLSSLFDQWILAAEYDEMKPSIVHRKCL